MLWTLWAVEGRLPRISRDSKRFKWLTKMIEKGEASKGDAHHITRSGTLLGL
jgi:hypothetical protein